MKTFITQTLVVIVAIALAVTLPLSALAEAGRAADAPARSGIWDGSIAGGFAGGTGTEADPYLISNGAQLAYLAQQVNSGTSYEGSYFELTEDIYLNDTTNWESWRDDTAPANEWTPIGTGDNSFSGSFDGNEHAVHGVYINEPEADYQGLFGYIGRYSTIANLGVSESYICGYNSYVGGVIGFNEGTVAGCYNTGNVSIFFDEHGGVGGVIGFNDGGNWRGEVTNCYNTGNVSMYGNNPTMEGSGAGGVVGNNYYAGAVTNCYNTGSVIGSNEVGGVVGSNYSGRVTNCYNTGSVTGSSAVGGVVGSNAGNDEWAGCVSCCYNTGSVNGSIEVGGVVGMNGYCCLVTNCYNTGSVTGNENVGGVAGSNFFYATVTNCYNTGSVTGNENVGGVAGSNATNEYAYGNVTNCYYLATCCSNGNEYGTALTDEQMRVADSFVGFDFVEVWTMEGNASYPYPELVGNYHGGINVIDDGFAGGTGTEDDPYLVSNSAELAFLAQQTNSGINFMGLFIELTNDIYLNDTTDWESWGDDNAPANAWTPIGTFNNRFSGSFDGNGFAVHGVYINEPESDYQGLFGCASRSTISNLEVSESYICGRLGVGGVVGDGSDYTISNCCNTGSVTGSEYVGGVVGYNNGIASNCYNTGSVTGGDVVGGVVGDSLGTVTNCYNTGSVTGDDVVGGVVSSNYETVANCYYLDTCCANGSWYGTALTDEQMRVADSFVGFDFVEVWTMEGNASYPYPELISNPHGGVSESVPGDLNNDGAVTPADALLVLRMALGLDISDSNGDVNGDGAVTPADALVILRWALGL